jgi:hypothetical protein
VQIEPARASLPSFAGVRARGGGATDAVARTVLDESVASADRTSDRPRVTSVHATAAVISRVPRPALLVMAGASAIALLVIGAISVRSSDTLTRLEATTGSMHDGAAPAADDPSGSSTDDRATLEELASARSQGLTALGALAQKYPNDPAVLRALLFGHAKDPSGYPAALGVAKRLLAIAPASADDDDLQRFLMAAAGGTPEIAAPALELMATGMGSQGPDLLFQLMNTAPRMKDRAARILAEPVVIERATPALRIAFELTLASSCKAKKPLLSRAAEYGDERSAAILRPLITSKGRGCGFFGLGNCGAPCASISKEIDEALKEIDARSSK